MPATDFCLEVKPRIPAELAQLYELANNLLYSWHRPTRELFYALDESLWQVCNHSPKLFLRRVEQSKLKAAAVDPAYLQKYHDVITFHQDYHRTPERQAKSRSKSEGTPTIAYFCAEFGFHQSLPTYSGGLGILAGDHCKAASDMALPFIAVGLLYHQGYFHQTIDAQGRQISQGVSQSFADLPIRPAKTSAGDEIVIDIGIANCNVKLRVWQVVIGRVCLYLLDSDLPANSDQDRLITNQLYGGDHHMRIQQEMILGIGGVRALRMLGYDPDVWHINEGHAAFLIVERIVELTRQGIHFRAALEQVAAGTVFTIHTPIAAGHDSFDEAMVVHYFSRYLLDTGIDFEEFLALGRSPANHDHFNMTSLALRGSRFHNGVSRIHGGVAARMEQHIWPQISANENPVTYITNGVHTESILHKNWAQRFDAEFPGWQQRLQEKEFGSYIDGIDDDAWWATHSAIKQLLIDDVKRRLLDRYRRNGLSQALTERSTAYLNSARSDALIIGFARRFATYKRATLLFSQLDRLIKLTNDPERPIIFIFAGKAHPGDEPGKELIRRIHDYSLQPDFIGKVLLLEGYDLAMAHSLVAGCDVWLNTPEYPLEACGTSGQKAGANGVVNFSITDGWWDEGYNGHNGWAVAPHRQAGFDPDYCNYQEALDILDILEHQVVPAYYQRDERQLPSEWIRRSKASMRSIISEFNAQRMLSQYVENLYRPAASQQRLIRRPNNAVMLAEWKKRVAECWPGVTAQCIDLPDAEIYYQEKVEIRVSVALNGLFADDLVVDCLLGQRVDDDFVADHCIRFQREATEKPAESVVFVLDWAPEFCGLKNYRIRIYPFHPLLSHPFEAGCMLWL